MGMYTEIHFNSKLKTDTPQDVIDTLKYMVNGEGELRPLDHPFFSARRWAVMLRMDSFYFDADTHSTLRYDDFSKAYYLCVRSNLKNYQNEISLFVDWITPCLDKLPGDFLGFSRYEETENPTLIFMGEDKNITNATSPRAR